MNDESIVKIMQTLGLNYDPAIKSTEQFQDSMINLRKDLEFMKSTAIDTAKSINKAFTAEFGNIKASEIKKMFDQIEKQNKPVEIKVVTNKAEKAMNEFARSMGIKLDKNLKNQFSGLANSILGDFDQSKFDELANSIADSYEEAMKKYNKRIDKSAFADTDDVKIYEYLRKATIKLDESTIDAKKNVDGFSRAIQNLMIQSKDSGLSLDQMAQEMEGMFNVKDFGSNTEDIAARITQAVESVREMKHGFSDVSFDVPRTEIDKFVQESLGNLITSLFQIKSEAMAAANAVSSLSDTAESAGSKTGSLTESQKKQSETIQEVVRQYKAGIMEAKEFVRVAEELKVNKDQWGSLPVQAKQDQINLQNSLTKATREYAQSLKELEQYKDALTGTGDFSKQQAQITNQMNELIRLRKTLQIDAQEFMERASKFGPGTKEWDALNSKDQVRLVNEITKAEREHTKVLQEEAKIEKALRGEHKANVEEIKKGTLEKMKSQAASIQQRATTKGLSEEYAKQASTIRKQVEELQAKLQLEGKLSAEEVKQTQQLQEQLEILKAQTGTAISDKIRENPDWLGEEFQRRSSWFLTGTMFYGITNGAKEAYETIKDVEMGMVELARVMDDSSFVFDEYRDKLFQLGVDYGQTFENVQQIALRWAQSGYNVEDSLELAETSLLALNTAELDAQNATEAMIGIMAQWQLEAEDMALVMDKVNITADNYSVTSQDLVDGLLRSSGAARIMNLSLDETIGLLTVMREASGRTGAEVGSALNSILSYIQRPKSIDLLESLGINMFTDEAKTQFRSVLDIFKDIASNWNTLSAEIQDGFVQSADDADLFNEELATALGMQEEWNDLQQRDISQAAAGVYRRNYFIGMIERLANVQGVLNNMMDAEGYSMRENAQTMETLEKKNQSLKASLEALAVAAGDAGLGGSLKSLANGGTSALNTINKMPKGMKDLTMATISTFLAVKALDLGMKTFGINLPGVSEMIKELTSGTWNLAKAFKSGKEGLASFLSANGPLLALSASIGAIVAITNHIKKQREEQEKAIQVSKENIESLEEQRQGLSELASEYEALKEKEKNLTATADEKTRLRDIQRELVDLYGVSITGIDAEGQAYADSTIAIRDRIKALEEEKTLEMEKLESAVTSKDKQDVKELEKNLKKRKQIARDIADVQKQIDEQLRILESGGTTTAPTGHGRRYEIDASTENGAKLLKEYIGRLSSEKSALQTSLGEVNTAIEEGTSDRERLLKEDATRIVQALSENGAEISDETRAFAAEMAGALSQVPEDILAVRDNLEEAIREFTSSDFTEWVEKYNKALAENNTEGIDEAANAINGLVREVSQGKPEMDNFVIAMEGLYPTTKQIASAAENTEKQTLDLAGAMGRMGNTAKKAMDDLKTLNQTIYDVKHGQSLSIDTVLELIEKYDLSTNAIKQTTDGYTIEASALEKLRGTKIKTAMDGIKSEKQTAQNTINAVKQRLEAYGLEIEMLGNLAEARRVLAQQASKEARKKVTSSRMEEVGFDVALKEVYNDSMASAFEDIAEYNDAVVAMEELNKRAELLGGMLGNSDYGVTKKKDKKGKKAKKDEPNFIDPIDAEIRAIKNKNDNLEKSNKLLREQLDLVKNTESIEGLNKQYELNGKLIENNKKLLQSYKKEQNTLHDKANSLRNKNKKYNIDSWFDANAEQTQAYVNQYDKLSRKEQENMDKVFQQMQKYKKAWMDSNKEAKNVINTTKKLEKETENLVKQQEDLTRNKLKDLIEAEKRNAYLDLELRQRQANEELKRTKQEMEDKVKSKQDEVDRIQKEIDDIQESERARQENLERAKRLEEISKLQNKYYTLQYQNLSDLTEEQAESLGLEREREASLKRREDIEKEQIKRQEYQNELLELRNKLENIRNQKTIRQYKELEDGTWDFVHVADQDAIDNVEKQIKDTEEKIEDSNKQIEDLEKEHNNSLKDLKEQTLEDLKKAQESYDEWERQNDIRKQIESKQQRIKEYQDEIKDLQDKYTEKERITNEALATERENLDKFYYDIDVLTDEKMKELQQTFGDNWEGIYNTLTDKFSSITEAYLTMVDVMSQPIDTEMSNEDIMDYNERIAREQGVTLTNNRPSDKKSSSKNDWSKTYNDARAKGDYKTMEYANRQANIERGKGNVVTSDKDIEYIKKKVRGFDTGGYTGSWGKGGKLAILHEKERVLNQQQTKAFDKFVEYVPDLSETLEQLKKNNYNKLVARIPDMLKGMQTSQNLIPNIDIPSLNQNLVNSYTTHNQPTQIIHNHIDKLVFPDVHDAKEIENSVLGLPRMTIQNG